MSGRLSTHVLDTAAGRPADGMEIELFRLDAAVAVAVESAPIVRAVTNADGRTGAPLLAGSDLAVGRYRLLFHVGDYYRSKGHPDAGRFLDTVPVDFVIGDAGAAYHVPLLVTPWSYSTYRGS